MNAIEEVTKNIEVLLDLLQQPNGDEECAVLVRRGDGYAGHAVPNRHEKPGTDFRVLKSDVDAVLDGGTLLCVAHTHTAPGQQEPSMEDVEGVPDGLLGLVVHPRSKSWTLYDNKVGVVAFHDGSKR